MRSPLRLTVLAPIAALGFAVALIGPAAAAPVVGPATYRADVIAGANALERFGVILQNTADLPALQAKTPRARVALTQFDRRMYVIGRYRVNLPAANRQRARIARSAPPVTDALTRFLDAALLGDTARLGRLEPVVRARIDAFVRAATG